MNKVAGLNWNSAGYAALSGPLLALFNRIDSIFQNWATSIGADDHRFPNLIALADLKPIAYLQSFPHLATFACSPGSDHETLTLFASENRAASQVQCEPGWEASQQILTPAACYHFYPRLANQELGHDRYLTTVCSCHRREQEYHPLERQWCFNMRELVCIGKPEAVENFVNQSQQRIDRLVQRLGLEAQWQVATDPFFDPLQDPKAVAQQIEPVKRELVLADGLAIASINRHRSFFGECYGITRDESFAHSACVAFGLERWLCALLRHFGKDPENWPALEAMLQ